MTGIQRFIMVVLCIGIVMICFPDFGTAGWTFAGTLLLVWTGIIVIMSIIGSLFALYRFEGINRFLSWVLLLGALGSVLWLLPQDDKVSPINKIKHGQLPTGADIKRGINKFTFNFAFDRRNARDDANFINQQDPREEAKKQAQKAAKEKARKAAQKALETLDIVVED